MYELISIAIFIAIVALVIGLFKPGLVKKDSIEEVLKFYAKVITVLIILLALVAPEPSIEDRVDSARDYLNEENYQSAVIEFEEIINDWEGNEDYDFSKQEIEKELEEAKSLYVEDTIKEIEEIVFADEVSENEIKEAKSKLENIKQYASDSRYFGEIEKQIADNYANKAISLLQNWEIEEAISYIEKVKDLSPEHERIEVLNATVKKARQIIDEIGEKPEVDSNGKVKIVKEHLNNRLNDPRSIEYIDWSDVSVTNTEDAGYVWQVVVEYRAKNEWGAYEKNQEIYFIRNNSVYFWRDYTPVW